MTSQPTWPRAAITIVLSECSLGRCADCPGGLCQHHCHTPPASPAEGHYLLAVEDALELAKARMAASSEAIAAAARLVRDWRTEAADAERGGTRGHITADALRACAAELAEIITQPEDQP